MKQIILERFGGIKMRIKKAVLLLFLVFIALPVGASDDPETAGIAYSTWTVMTTATNAPGGDWTAGTDYCGHTTETLANAIDAAGNDYWQHNVDEQHYFILYLGATDKKVIGFRSYSTLDARGPTAVNIYIDPDNNGNTGLTTGSVPAGWGSSVFSSAKSMLTGTAASYPSNATDYAFDTAGVGKYALVHITDTAYSGTPPTDDYLRWGDNANVGAQTGLGIAAFEYLTIPETAFSTIYDPVDSTDCEWSESSAVDCETLVGYQSGASTYIYYEGESSNVKDTLNWNLPDEAWVPAYDDILGVRVWWKGVEEADGEGDLHRKYWPNYLEAGKYYATYADYTMMFNDTLKYYYIEYPYDPSDGQPWTFTDLDTEIFKHSMLSLNPLPGGKITEWYIEVLWAGASGAGAYLTHRPWAGGETDTEMIVKARASGTSEIRLGHTTSIGSLMECLSETDCTGVTLETDPGGDNALEANDYVHTWRATGLDADTVYYWLAFVDGSPSHLLDGANVERLGTERTLSNYPDGDSYTISASSPGWGVNAWAEYQVVITSGDGTGLVYTVASNTEDTLTCNEKISADVNYSDKFVLCRPHCKWTSPPAFKTAPTAQLDVDHTEILIGDMHSYSRDERLYESAGAEGAHRVIFLGDNHAENSQAMQRELEPLQDYGTGAAPYPTAGVMEGYRRLVVGNDSVNQHLRDNILNDHTIAAATISDHDYGGNNPSKTGDLPVNCYSGAHLNDTDHIEAIVDFSNTNSTIVISPGIGLEEIKVYEDNIIIEVTGNATYNGYYQADIDSKAGTSYTFSVTPAPASDDNNVSCIVCFHKRKMFNCVDAFKTYMPTRIDPDGDGLGDVITAGGTIEWPIPAIDLEGTSTAGGDADTLVDASLKEWQFEYDNLATALPEPGDDIDINGDDGMVLYYDPTDSTTGTMFVRMDSECVLEDGDTVQVEGGGDWSCTIDADGGEHLGWIKEGPFGLYPGMVVHYEPDDADDYSLSFVKSISGTTLELSEALWAGETFAANSGENAYRFQRTTLNARGYHARDQYITLDVRGKRDHSISTYGNPGGDWIDGTNDHINPKIDGETVTGVSGTTLDCSGCGFEGVDTDPFGRPVRVGDLVECDFDGDGTYDDDSNYYALVASIEDSDTIVLSQVITGCEVNDKIRVSESGGSEHGSRKANINAGHVMREWFLDSITTEANGGSRPSWVRWVLVICEQPIHDFVAESRADKPGAFDPLDGLRQYLLTSITPVYVVWVSADRHYAALYDTLDAAAPYPGIACSPAFATEAGYDEDGFDHDGTADAVAVHPALGNHYPGDEWTKTISGVDYSTGWGSDEAADYQQNGNEAGGIHHNMGAYGTMFFDASEKSLVATVYNPDGTLCSNQRAIGGTRTINSVNDTTINISPSPAWVTNELEGYVIRIVSCAADEDTVGLEFSIDTNDADDLVFYNVDLDTTYSLAAGDTFQIYNKMFMGIDSNKTLGALGDLTMTLTVETYFFPAAIHYRAIMQGTGY